MSYIYDIILNLNSSYYDFFEWRKEDNTINIKKIPLMRISIKDYNDLKNNNVILGEKFINAIANLSLNYSRKKFQNVCLVSDGYHAMGLLFNTGGKLIKRSGMLIDEEEESVEEANKLEIISLEFLKNEKLKTNNILRIEKEKKEYIYKYLNNLDNEKLLKYIYYDYFEKEEENVFEIKRSLFKEINNDWNNNINNLYSLILLINSK